MFSIRPLLLLIPFALTGVALGQEEAGKDVRGDQKKDEAEVQFANGSTVRMAIMQDRIEVMTRYGKLAIPLADIQRIEFGVHLTLDDARNVDAAVVKLASVQYSERDEGMRELIILAGKAYPALLRAAKSNDQEVARRVEKILTAVREQVPEKELRSREEDVISTPGFTIVGRIVTSALKGKSEYFGNVQLQLTQLRHLRTLRAPGETQLAIDAGQYGSAHGQWMDTGLYLESGTALLLAASGTVDIYPQSPGQYVSTPKGYGNNVLTPGAKVVATPANMRNFAGALFARIGEASEAFYVGERFEGNAGREGKLYLHIVPSPWNNASSGTYQVRLTARN